MLEAGAFSLVVAILGRGFTAFTFSVPPSPRCGVFLLSFHSVRLQQALVLVDDTRFTHVEAHCSAFNPALLSLPEPGTETGGPRTYVQPCFRQSLVDGSLLRCLQSEFSPLLLQEFSPLLLQSVAASTDAAAGVAVDGGAARPAAASGTFAPVDVDGSGSGQPAAGVGDRPWNRLFLM